MGSTGRETQTMDNANIHLLQSKDVQLAGPYAVFEMGLPPVLIHVTRTPEGLIFSLGGQSYSLNEAPDYVRFMKLELK